MSGWQAVVYVICFLNLYQSLESPEHGHRAVYSLHNACLGQSSRDLHRDHVPDELKTIRAIVLKAYNGAQAVVVRLFGTGAADRDRVSIHAEQNLRGRIAFLSSSLTETLFYVHTVFKNQNWQVLLDIHTHLGRLAQLVRAWC